MSELINDNEPLIYDEIRSKCKEYGISLSELCRRGGIHRHQFKAWKHENPKSIETLKTLEKELKKIAAVESNGFYCKSDSEVCKNQCTFCKTNFK